MKKSYLNEVLSAVDSFKDAAGATITDVRKFFRSLGRKIACKTLNKCLTAATRRGYLQMRGRRYYPKQAQFLESRRGRRTRRGKRGKPKCPCFSKAKYLTANKRSRRRRRRLESFDNLEARRRRRTSRRRRTRRRMRDLQDLQSVEAGLFESRRRRRSSRRRTRRRVVEEDNSQKRKAKSKRNFLIRPIKIEKDLLSLDGQEQSEFADETENHQNRESVEGIKEEKVKSDKEKSHSEDKAGMDENDKDDGQPQNHNQCTSQIPVDDGCTCSNDPDENMYVYDDCDDDMYY